MRQVTAKAVHAFLNRAQICVQNTAVETNQDGETFLKLHGNTIASLDSSGVLRVSTAGWDTMTTRERLNGLPGVEVRKKSGQLLLNGEAWDGGFTAVNI